MTRLGTRLNSSGIVLNLSNNISSDMTTILLGGTVNGGLAYVFMSRNVLEGGRFHSMVRSCGYLNLGIVNISTSRGFFTSLTNIASPRRGHGVVNHSFMRIFGTRTGGRANTG